jgi:hypothetical protein
MHNFNIPEGGLREWHVITEKLQRDGARIKENAANLSVLAEGSILTGTPVSTLSESPVENPYSQKLLKVYFEGDLQCVENDEGREVQFTNIAAWCPLRELPFLERLPYVQAKLSKVREFKWAALRLNAIGSIRPPPLFKRRRT